VMNDETLPNFLKRKHPSQEEKKKQSARTVWKSPKEWAPWQKRNRWVPKLPPVAWSILTKERGGRPDNYSSCTGRSHEIYVAVVERRSGKRKDRMKLSLSSKLVEKLVWVPILWLCIIFILNCSFMFDALVCRNWLFSALIIWLYG
jgi:hypothetical protein